jgi:hypothetical protein
VGGRGWRFQVGRTLAGREAAHLRTHRLGDVGDVQVDLLEQVGVLLHARRQRRVLLDQCLDVVGVV